MALFQQNFRKTMTTIVAITMLITTPMIIGRKLAAELEEVGG